MRIFASIAVLFILTGATFHTVFSQTSPENQAERVQKEKIPIRGSERIDFILGRNFQLPVNPGMLDSVPIDPTRSGSSYLGVSFSFPFGRVFALKLEPRATWNKLYFNDIGSKRFPTDSSNVYFWEKHRMFYPELAGGVKFNLARNKNEKVTVFIEAGGFFGYNIGAMYKRRSTRNDHNYTEKFSGLEGVNKLRYGAYLRLGTAWVALNLQYRFSTVYDSKALYEHPNRTGVFVPYPKPGSVELGVVILL